MNPVTRKDNIHVEQLANEVVIYDRLNHKAHCLNQTVFAVWENSDGSKNIEQLSELLSSKFGIACGNDLVLFALEELRKVNLLEGSIDLPAKPELPTRRQIGRKLALAGASVSMLPCVASVLAPTPAMARSYNAATYTQEWATVKSETKPKALQLALNKNNSLTHYTNALLDGTKGGVDTGLGKVASAQNDFQAAENEFNLMLKALGLPPL